MTVLNGQIAAVKYGATNLDAVYWGDTLIWPPPTPPGGTVNYDYSAGYLEDILGRPTTSADMPAALFPPDDTGFPAQWPISGVLTAVAENTVVVMTASAAAGFAGGHFEPYIAHNGNWWRMTGPHVGVALTSSHSRFGARNNTFRGFMLKTKTYDKLPPAQYKSWGVTMLNDDQFAFVVDVANHAIEIAAGSGNMAAALAFAPPTGSSFAYHLPPGVTDADVIWPETVMSS